MTYISRSAKAHTVTEMTHNWSKEGFLLPGTMERMVNPFLRKVRETTVTIFLSALTKTKFRVHLRYHVRTEDPRTLNSITGRSASNFHLRNSICHT